MSTDKKTKPGPAIAGRSIVTVKFADGDMATTVAEYERRMTEDRGAMKMLDIHRSLSVSQKRRAGSAVRPGARSTLKSKILNLMRQAKPIGGTFKDWLAAWEKDPIGDLRLTANPKGFVVVDEDGDDLTGQSYRLSTLQKMWSVA